MAKSTAEESSSNYPTAQVEIKYSAYKNAALARRLFLAPVISTSYRPLTSLCSSAGHPPVVRL